MRVRRRPPGPPPLSYQWGRRVFEHIQPCGLHRWVSLVRSSRLTLPQNPNSLLQFRAVLALVELD
eukprot:4746275-Pyramimonas_sp.AAC.1